MHAIRHRINPIDVGRIVEALDAAGVDAIEVAHGDGLAGGSISYGPGSHTDWQWLEAAADKISRARLTTLLLPGIGTIEDLRRAYALGARSVRIATHCSEADIAASHITAARELDMDVSGFLMMSHMAEPAELAGQAKLMESYGAHCVYVTDSGGRLTMDGVRSGDRDRNSCPRESVPIRCEQSRRGRGGGHSGRCVAGRTGCWRRKLSNRSVHRGSGPAGVESQLRSIRTPGRRR
jgi:4-hydroxy-2-oxovalerate aldolase